LSASAYVLMLCHPMLHLSSREERVNRRDLPAASQLKHGEGLGGFAFVQSCGAMAAA